MGMFTFLFGGFGLYLFQMLALLSVDEPGPGPCACGGPALGLVAAAAIFVWKRKEG